MRRDFSLLEVVVLGMSLHLHLRGGVVDVLLRVGWRFLFSNGRCSMGRKKKMRKNWRGQRKIENSEKRMALQQARERENGILKKGGNEACFYRSMFCRLVKQAPLREQLLQLQLPCTCLTALQCVCQPLFLLL